MFNKPCMRSFFVLFSFLFVFTLSSVALVAQTGKISGKVMDDATGETLIGATVQIEGTNQGAATDIEGKFLLTIAPGDYTLILSSISYKTEKVSVSVQANEVTYLTFVMKDAATSLNEVVIVHTVAKSSSVALLSERKNSAMVSDGISADVIRRTPDRTTSDVLKRVTGASIQEGKFAVIRGMNDRYNIGSLDGALLPSTEADRKAFAFDAVPASLLDNLQIIKTGTPDLLGDFGGGMIRLTTKSVPEKFTQSISIGGHMHSLTTFKDFKQFKTYPSETFNIMSSKRDMPNIGDMDLRLASTFATLAEKEQFAGVTKTFNNDWSSKMLTAMPNTRLAYSLGIPIEFDQNKKLGIILALNYSQTRQTSLAEINTFDGSGQVSAFKDQGYNQNVSTGGIFNINYVGPKTQVNFRNLLNANSDNKTINRTGIANIGDALEARNFANLVNYNRLYNSIVSVKQIVGADLFQVNASINYANIHRSVPDYRIVNYFKTPDFDEERLSLGDFFNTSSGRFMSDLTETLYGNTVELSKKFSSEKVKTDIKIGQFYQQRSRTFYGRSFVYNGQPGSALTYDPENDLSEQNIGASGLYLVEKTSNEIAYYEGKSNLSAFYAMADQKLFNKVRAVYGVRYEHADIDVNNQKTNTDVAKLTQGIVLPSVNLAYQFTEKFHLRGSYFSSVNRPEFRELAPFAFFVFDKNAEIRGNSQLQIATLNNYDLRAEFFPSGSQVVSVGGFYKQIKNPIEFSIDISQPFTTFTYQNEREANIYGLELEFRKNLVFLGENSPLRYVTAYSNLTLIKSSLTFKAGSQASADRPLQGQSPYVLNAGLQYDNTESGWFGSVAVNQVGRRIAYVGVDPTFGDTRQDIYEQPRLVLDLQFGKNIGMFNLKLTLGDLLRRDLIYYQDTNKDGKYAPGANGDDRLMFKFTNGFSGSVTAAYSF
jgi:TonB-dependent receptor